MIFLKIIALIMCALVLLFILFIMLIFLLSMHSWFAEKNDEFFENCRKNLRINDVLW